ncbi:MAG: SGNH/GDSL hydrolase family protein [Roseivirga sp.]
MNAMKYLAILLLTLMLSCQSDDNSPSYSYLALGDSYTIGQSVEESERWPVQLTSALNQRGTPVRPPVFIAQTGWRTERLIQQIENAGNLGAQYDMVSLLIGVNNQFSGRSVESFTPDFEKLLQMSIALAGDKPQRVFVLSIPDYGKTLFGSSRGPNISEEIDMYNAASKALCDQYGIAYFDITPISREVETDPELTASDGLHPSGKMYKRWVDLIVDDVNELLDQ